MIFPGLFALIVGTGMIGIWLYLLLSRQVPELQNEPYRIRFHIAAEMITAITLLIGGISLLTAQLWGQWFYLIALGMLFYTVIASPGYYVEKGEWPFVGMFAIILVLALASLTILV